MGMGTGIVKGGYVYGYEYIVKGGYVYGYEYIVKSGLCMGMSI